MNSLTVVCCLLAAFACGTIAEQQRKTFGQVADCFHENLLQCHRQCDEHVDDSQRAAIVACMETEHNDGRTKIHECLATKGINRDTTDCFAVDHQHYVKSMLGNALKFDVTIRNALKQSAICFKGCLDERAPQADECQAGCGEASEDTTNKIKACVHQIRAGFPSETLKQCLASAIAQQSSQDE